MVGRIAMGVLSLAASTAALPHGRATKPNIVSAVRSEALLLPNGSPARAGKCGLLSPLVYPGVAGVGHER